MELGDLRLRARLFEDLIWMSQVLYLNSIFQKLNTLNLSMQGAGGDVFTTYGKITSFKSKVKLWRRNVENSTFLSFPDLEAFFKTCDWVNAHPDLVKK